MQGSCAFLPAVMSDSPSLASLYVCRRIDRSHALSSAMTTRGRGGGEAAAESDAEAEVEPSSRRSLSICSKASLLEECQSSGDHAGTAEPAASTSAEGLPVSVVSVTASAPSTGSTSSNDTISTSAAPRDASASWRPRASVLLPLPGRPHMQTTSADLPAIKRACPPRSLAFSRGEAAHGARARVSRRVHVHE